MDLNYHIFKKSTKSKNKTVHKWYYYWNDPVTGVMHQKVCKSCKTRVEAYAFVSTLPPLFVEEKITIAKIAEWMYIPGGQHMERMEKLGKTLTPETLRSKRFMLNIFVEEFGELELSKLTIPMIIDFLSEDYHSGSWKNNFLTVVSEVYAEAPFHDLPYIPVPLFPKFRRNSRKKDIFSTEELNILFNESLWMDMSRNHYSKHPQFDEGILVIDGFYKSNQLYRTNYTKCGSEEDKKLRVAPLPEDLAQILRNYILQNNLSGNDYVFMRYGKPIRKWLAEEWFRRILSMSDINAENRILTPHSLRYTYITRMRREVAGETVQKIAGHNSLAMTDHYTRAAISEMVEAVKPAMEAANRLFE